MSSMTLGRNDGQVNEFVYLEELYAATRNLYQFECVCGEKFFTMVYAITHCTQNHEDGIVEQLIKPASLITTKEDLMSVYDDCINKIRQEFEKRLEKRLKNLETNLRLEYEENQRQIMEQYEIQLQFSEPYQREPIVISPYFPGDPIEEGSDESDFDFDPLKPDAYRQRGSDVPRSKRSERSRRNRINKKLHKQRLLDEAKLAEGQQTTNTSVQAERPRKRTRGDQPALLGGLRSSDPEEIIKKPGKRARKTERKRLLLEAEDARLKEEQEKNTDE